MERRKGFSPQCLLHGQFFGGTHIEDRDSGLLSHIVFVVFKIDSLNSFYNYVILALVATAGSKASCDFLFCVCPISSDNMLGGKSSSHSIHGHSVSSKRARQILNGDDSATIVVESRASASPCLALLANFWKCTWCKRTNQCVNRCVLRHPGPFVKNTTYVECLLCRNFNCGSLADTPRQQLREDLKETSKQQWYDDRLCKHVALFDSSTGRQRRGWIATTLS